MLDAFLMLGQNFNGNCTFTRETQSSNSLSCKQVSSRVFATFLLTKNYGLLFNFVLSYSKVYLQVYYEHYYIIANDV
jgi:hypothetical protein